MFFDPAAKETRAGDHYASPRAVATILPWKVNPRMSCAYANGMAQRLEPLLYVGPGGNTEVLVNPLVTLCTTIL